MNGADCLFEAVTVYDQTTYGALVRLMMRKLRRWPRIALLTLGFGTLGLSAYRVFTIPGFDLVSVIIMLFGDAMIILGVFAEPFMVRMLCAQTGQKNPLTNRYIFFENCLEILPGTGQTVQIPYEKISRILKYEQYLFLFLDDRNTYILDLKCLKRGAEPALQDFLNRKLAARAAG